jgi:hypothetical protein
MDRKQMEEFIIESYRRDEETMILIFAQWCVNRGLDPAVLYARAYPQQAASPALTEAIALTVPKEQADAIDDETLLTVLSLFNNEDLAFVVTEEMHRSSK